MKRVELLAPAGGPEQFKAAVNAGCNAIYLGGSLFNARIGAGNFTLEEMKEAIDYGHLRGVRTYVTLNTLMTDYDLPKALRYASKLYELGVDALIIQDLGLGRAVRESMPDFELHLSTQATVYSPDGVRAAQALGYQRTVLSRECNLEEIRASAEVGEVEIFVHGALCICYSGQCQLSRYIGGRSGNKGMCAQPCRLPYTYLDTKGNELSLTNPLSPKDMCLIDRLGELIEAGAASFKIEGRMKSPEYVATVVSIYRKYIDEYYERGSYEVSEADRQALLQAFNRNGFTEGYLMGDPEDDLMSAGISKNTGVYVGRIARNSAGLYADAYLTEDVKMHDVLEIRSKARRSSFKVTSINENRDKTTTLGDIKDKVCKGDSIYRLISQNLTQSARDKILTPRKVPVQFFLMAKANEPLKLTAKDPIHNISFSLKDPTIEVQPALKRALSEDDILKQLSKTGDTAYYLGKANIIMDENIFLPVSALNSARRQVLDGLEREVIASYERAPISLSYDVANQDTEFGGHGTVFDADADSLVLPQVSKGPYNEWLKDNLSAVVSRLKESKSSVIVNNLEWIEAFSKAGIKVIGGPGLNISNRSTIEALMELGMSDEYVNSPELLDKADMEGIPLMIAEHRMTPGALIDRRGAKYAVEFDTNTHKSYIFPVI